MTRPLYAFVFVLFLASAAQAGPTYGNDISGRYVDLRTGQLCTVQRDGDLFLFTQSNGSQAVFQILELRRGILTLLRHDGGWPDSVFVTLASDRYGRVILTLHAPGVGREIWQALP